MPSGKLHTYPGNFRAYKAQIAAKYSGYDLKVPSDFVFGETNKQNSFLQKFPFGKVPALEDADGTCVFESNAIAWHVADDTLRGISNKSSASASSTPTSAAAHVIQWMSFADNELLPAVCSWTFPVQGIIVPANVNAATMQRARDELSTLLHALNQHLLTHTYLAAECITLADIVVCCTLLPAFQLVLDPEFRRPFGNVVRWFNTVINQPHVKSVLGDVKLCSEAPSLKPAASGKAKEKKPKQENQKPKQPKQEKPKKQQKNEEEVELAPPKPVDPFASHPKSSWIVDDFKRFYSNNDEDKAIDYFWQHFDKENFSIWYCDYKYNEELTLTFMSLNLISGMLQRLGNLRKNAFASMCVFGGDNNMSISGVWVWRGQDLVFTLSPDWSVEYDNFEWKKLDVNSDETKALVRKYFKWEGTDAAGRPFNDGEIYK